MRIDPPHDSLTLALIMRDRYAPSLAATAHTLRLLAEAPQEVRRQVESQRGLGMHNQFVVPKQLPEQGAELPDRPKAAAPLADDTAVTFRMPEHDEPSESASACDPCGKNESADAPSPKPPATFADETSRFIDLYA